MIPRNRLLYCRYLDPEDTLPGGKIILLDLSKKAITSQQGIIVSVGTAGRDEEGDPVPVDERLLPGTWILHTAYKRIPSDNEGFFFVHEDDVVAVLA